MMTIAMRHAKPIECVLAQLNPLAPVYSFEFVVLLAAAVLYYKAAELEKLDHPMLWAGLSIAVSMFTWRFLSWGVIGCIGGQVVLAIGIGVSRVLRSR